MQPTLVAIALQTTPTPGVGPEELVDYWPVLRRAGWFLGGFLAVALFGWFVAEPVLTTAIKRRNRNNATIHEAISRYFRLVVLVVAFFVGIGFAGYGQVISDSALVIAAMTLVLGVAAQTVIGSLVSGLVLVLDPEFNVGNYIQWANGEGTVRSITLRVTRVQTVDGELTTIPNTVLTGQEITRPYGRGRFRVVDHVGLAYEDDVERGLELLVEAAGDVPEIVAEPNPEAYVDEFGSDAVVARVHYWVDRPRDRDIFAVRSKYAQAAKTRLDDAGITIAPASKRTLQGRIEVEESA